jgi:hypothetical protein
LILALFPLLSRRKKSLARRTLPTLCSTIESILGELTGNNLSTPTPSEILRTVKVAVAPSPWRLITSPLKD